jgi:hypothetical protein
MPECTVKLGGKSIVLLVNYVTEGRNNIDT